MLLQLISAQTQMLLGTNPIPNAAGLEIEADAALNIQSPTRLRQTTFLFRLPHRVLLLFHIMSFRFKIKDPKKVTAEEIRAAKSVTERQRLLVGNELHSDAIFLVGPDDDTALRIPVHSLLLTTASDSFQSMFSGYWKKEDVIRIKDCDPWAMCSVICWIYAGNLIVERGKFPEVKAIAEKYFVTSLLNFIADGHDEAVKSNPWRVMSFAVESGNNDLKDKCALQIAADIRKQMESAKFVDASEAAITALLSLSFTYDERMLFAKCVEWAARECHRQKLEVTPENQRKVMQSFIHLIAFPGMTAAEFAGQPCTSGILTDKEQVLIFRAIAGEEVETGFRKETRRESRQRLVSVQLAV